MNKRFLKGAISFLSGALWGFFFLSTLLVFFSTIKTGLLEAFFYTTITAIFWLFLIILVEIASLQLEKIEELKRQTKLLEKIHASLQDYRS